MRKGLETRRKNLDSFNEINEINWDGKSSSTGRTQEELESIRKLLESDWFKSFQEELRQEELKDEAGTSDAILKGIEESERSDEEYPELWSASDLGKYTINTPTTEKQSVEKTETQMQPISKEAFVEISEDIDKEDAELQKKLDKLVQEMEGIF